MPNHRHVIAALLAIAGICTASGVRLFAEGGEGVGAVGAVAIGVAALLTWAACEVPVPGEIHGSPFKF